MQVRREPPGGWQQLSAAWGRGLLFSSFYLRSHRFFTTVLAGAGAQPDGSCATPSAHSAVAAACRLHPTPPPPSTSCAVLELERSLMELHQIFLDMAVLVEAQGEMLDNIEAQVGGWAAGCVFSGLGASAAPTWPRLGGAVHSTGCLRSPAKAMVCSLGSQAYLAWLGHWEG